VPVLIGDGQILANSWEIALYADRVGHGSKLIPDELAVEVRRWHDLAERSLSAGRALTIARLLGNDAALEEMLPPATPRLARRWLRPVARLITRWFATKYNLDLENTAQAQAIQREGLDALRTALVRSEYVLGRFSYADIIAASLLQGVVPVAQRYLRLGPATRDVWTKPDLAAAYSDLVSWRDRLYERHRQSDAARAGAPAAHLDSVAQG
jgi:glutathione S-transferase